MGKGTIKEIANFIWLVVMLPLYAFHLLASAAGRNRDRSFWGISQMLSLVPGACGSYLRKGFYRLAMKNCSKDCAIMFGSIFSQADTEVGKGVYIGPNCNIGRCRIEDHCTLGSNVHVMSGGRQHNFDDLDTPIQEQGVQFEKVVIGENTWIGNGAIVMANIGRKCIVGAGSVVTKDVEEYSIVAGNPARVIRSRKEVIKDLSA